MRHESQLSAEIIKQIKSQGGFAYKTADKYQEGIPDIYVCGGTWIETKIVKCELNVNPMRLLRPGQKIYLDRFNKFGDNTFIFVGMRRFIGKATKPVIRFTMFDWGDPPERLYHEDGKQTIAEALVALARISR